MVNDDLAKSINDALRLAVAQQTTARLTPVLESLRAATAGLEAFLAGTAPSAAPAPARRRPGRPPKSAAKTPAPAAKAAAPAKAAPAKKGPGRKKGGKRAPQGLLEQLVRETLAEAGEPIRVGDIAGGVVAKSPYFKLSNGFRNQIAAKIANMPDVVRVGRGLYKLGK